MKAIFLTLVCLCFSLTSVAHDHGHEEAKAKPVLKDAKNFGGKVTGTEVLSLGEVTENFNKYDGKTITLEATAKKVCEKKGCWMVITDGKNEVRTLFKDYGFFVPKTILNQKIKVQGKMEKKKISAATIRHFMKDGGASRSEINKIKKGKVKFQFTADAVEII